MSHLSTFCLRLAAGMALALLVLPARQVLPRFYRIHLLIVLGLGVAAALAAEHDSDLFWLAVGFGLGGSVVGTWAWSLEGAPGRYACLLVTTAALATASISLTAPTAAGLSGAELTALVIDELTAAGLLGLAMTAMLMGHWHLIAPTMSMQPLMRLLGALFVMIGLRTATAGTGLAMSGFGSADALTWSWLALRWGAGLIGPAILAWMAWQSARIRSTQSATGILYVLVIFVFLGELTAQLLHGHTGHWL